MRRVLAAMVLAALLLSGAIVSACSSSSGDERTAERSDDGAPVSSTTLAGVTSSSSPLPVSPRPAWLGTRVLPLRPDGLGEIQPTPPELVDRRFASVDFLPPPDDDTFAVTVTDPPADVMARSTWSEQCPVRMDELRYLTLPFWGFGGVPRTGELLVHADAVDAVIAGFRRLHERRFPIEEMRVVASHELDLPPTGDGNNTTAFVCRPAVGSSTWSQHAFGRAVDVNPFHNPFVRGDVVIPELASSYAARPDLPGVLTDADVAGFDSVGWGWGGRWRSSKDWMHVSASGR